MIDEQLQTNSVSSFSAFEDDEIYLYRHDTSLTSLTSFNIINYFVVVYLQQQIIILVILIILIHLNSTFLIHYHSMYLLLMHHFIDMIKQSNGARQEAIQVNIFRTVLAALKILAQTRQYST
jgi:hypothetical protein